MSAVELDAGATLEWDADHGDEALFVEAGALAIGDRVCPAGGAVVVEARARATIEARAASRILHMGARDFAAPRPEDRGDPEVHVVGPRGVYEAIEPGRETRFFADATCPGCQLWLLFTARSFDYVSAVHSHAQDELIHVLRGEIAIGSLRAGPGSTVFIAADQPYGFRGAAGGFAFLNYRRAPSRMTIRKTGQVIVENGAATGMTRVSPPPPIE